MNGELFLVVTPDPVMQRRLTALLHEWGHEAVVADSIAEASSAFAGNRFACSLVELKGDGAEKTDFLRTANGDGGNLGAVILVSDVDELHAISSDVSSRVADILPRTFAADELERAIQEALARPEQTWKPLRDEDLRLRQEMALCTSPTMQEVWHIVWQAAGVDVTVLICGETGTGKDVVARAIHHLSSRRNQPFVKVNCAAVPKELLESELFGHERGAFTGAHQLKIGKFESANRGTVFLDEIGDLHPALQAKLLHVLQDGSFSRVGGKSVIKVDVRVLAATNHDLTRAVAADRFREDLYYRLNVIEIVVPPLRERTEEIPRLANYFIGRYSKLFKRPELELGSTTMERLMQHRYPGNIRELENIIKRMIVLRDPRLVRIALQAEREPNRSNGATEVNEQEPISLKEVARSAARAAEREAIARALKQTRWNRVKAAKLLKISYRALLYKIRYVGLEKGRTPRSASVANLEVEGGEL